ncbi:minor tail protein [Microbacterium phage Pumpernickel]|uniref:Minor tail protein n=1 Tax=Microbacterium phage Pumpernickel TaxID=2885983 RepID=A0AAE9C3F5_9CAUD|nr:minor tail protein [Microbacterium phage Pumpernickel]UDL15889.1 minor tail protein [Microbacterium phage Pumpernickel]
MSSERARSIQNLGARMTALTSAVEDAKARTRTPAASDTETRLELVEARLELLGSANYRAEEDFRVLGSDRAQAVLDPAYIGPGPARVTLLPNGTLSTEAYEWRGDFYYWGNRVVNMVRVDGRWFIEGHAADTRDALTGQGRGGIVRLNLVNGWTNYGDYTGSYQYADAQAQRLPSGIVVLSGLPGQGTVTTDTVIATLPEGFRPDTDMIFPTLNGNNWRAITVAANGEIRVRANTVNTFVSFDGIAFPAAGVATWTDIGAAGSGSSFANSWGPHVNASWGTPAYWKDPYGLVWFRGLLTGGSTAADNTNMVTMPATHRSALQQHYPAASSEQFGLVGARATDGLNYKNGTLGTAWISLGGVTIMTQDAFNSGVWFSPVMTNSWANYDTNTYPGLAMTRREDGLGLSRGFIRNGTVAAGTRAWTAPKNMLPAMSWLTPRPAGQAAGRVDMYGHRSAGSSSGIASGTCVVNFGSNSWVSLDGMKWMVGEL